MLHSPIAGSKQPNVLIVIGSYKYQLCDLLSFIWYFLFCVPSRNDFSALYMLEYVSRWSCTCSFVMLAMQDMLDWRHIEDHWIGSRSSTDKVRKQGVLTICKGQLQPAETSGAIAFWNALVWNIVITVFTVYYKDYKMKAQPENIVLLSWQCVWCWRFNWE